MIRLTRTYTSGVFRLFKKSYNGKAPNNPNNQTQATCQSDEDDRYYHAASDFAAWRLLNFGSALRTGRGESVAITYDDGATETFIWIPGRFPSSTSPPETYLAMVPGSKRCTQ